MKSYPELCYETVATQPRLVEYGTSYTEMSRWSAFQGKRGKTRKNTVMRVQLELTHSIAQFTEFPLES